MDIKNTDLVFKYKQMSDFDLTHIFDCGQCFRFNKNPDGSYTGVAHGRALTVFQNGDGIVLCDTPEKDLKNIWLDFFDLDRDYSYIKSILSADPVMADAIRFGSGIRILNQDLWESIISFIISASNNIPRIKGIIERLSENFGKKIEYMGKTYYSFPTPKELEGVTVEDLSVIRAGYRDKYIVDAVTKFNSGILSADYINSLSTPDAKKALMSIKGVGNKVADCILLFGMNRADSFPVDVWIKRIMEFCYFDGKEQSIKTISEFAAKKFGNFGGYAQQYLFFYARENRIGTE